MASTIGWAILSEHRPPPINEHRTNTGNGHNDREPSRQALPLAADANQTPSPEPASSEIQQTRADAPVIDKENMMRKIVNSTFVSLDGVINHMEHWHFDYVDAESGAFALQQIRSADAMLMGHNTYEIYASAWPGRDDELANELNAIAKHVAATTPLTAAWNNTTVIDGDLVDAVAELKRQPGKDILMHGYGPVAKALMTNDLLDELCLWVHPMLAGVGEADDLLLHTGLNKRLTLSDVHPLASGVVVLTYSTH